MEEKRDLTAAELDECRKQRDAVDAEFDAELQRRRDEQAAGGGGDGSGDGGD